MFEPFNIKRITKRNLKNFYRVLSEDRDSAEMYCRTVVSGNMQQNCKNAGIVGAMIYDIPHTEVCRNPYGWAQQQRYLNASRGQ